MADVADDGAGADRPDTEHLGHGGAGGFDRCDELLAGLAQLGIQAAGVGHELGGELAAGLSSSTRRPDLAEDPGGLRRGDLPADNAGHQIAQRRVQPAGGLVAGPGQIPVPPGLYLQHHGMILLTS